MKLQHLSFKTINKNHNPIIFNSVLWLCSFIILLFIFSKGKQPIKIDYIYTFGFISSIIIPVLINFYILIPQLLKKEKYVVYTLSFTVNLILFSQLNVWLFKPILDYIFPNYFFISYHSNTRLITIFSIFLIVTTLLKLAEDWIHFNKNEHKILKQQNHLIQGQLTALRSQINPHFLFNSLNVIYDLALQKSNETKDAIIQLSDILRYIIYDTNTKQITIDEEIELLDNYIQFQKFRVQGFKNISFNKSVDNPNFKLYPMLLLPLVENSFKHGIKDDVKKTYLNINLTLKNNILVFIIENNNSENNITHKDNSGIGLENIKKNLEINYPNNHVFLTQNSNNKFIATLKLFKTYES